MDPLIAGHIYALSKDLQLLARAEKAEADLAVIKALCVRHTEALNEVVQQVSKCLPQWDNTFNWANSITRGKEALALTPADLSDHVVVRREEWERLVDKPHAQRVKEFLEELSEYLGIEGEAKPEDFINVARLNRENTAALMSANAALTEELRVAKESYERVADKLAVTKAELQSAEQARDKAVQDAKALQTVSDNITKLIEPVRLCKWEEWQKQLDSSPFPHEPPLSRVKFVCQVLCSTTIDLVRHDALITTLRQQNAELVAALEEAVNVVELHTTGRAQFATKRAAKFLYQACNIIASRGEQAKAAEGGKA